MRLGANTLILSWLDLVFLGDLMPVLVVLCRMRVLDWREQAAEALRHTVQHRVKGRAERARMRVALDHDPRMGRAG